MSKFLTAIMFALFFSFTISAQTSGITTTTENAATTATTTAASTNKTAAIPPVPAPTTSIEPRKNEFYVGYSNQQVDTADRTTFHGFEFSYTRYVSRYFGIRGTVSGAYNKDSFNVPTLTPGGNAVDVRTNSSVYNFLGGVQIKDNMTTSRFKPFGFAMGGVAVNKNRAIVTTCTSPACMTATGETFRSSDTGLAGSFGGGLDIRINDRFDFRLIQVDYNPIYSDSRVDNNFRFGIGFVFR